MKILGVPANLSLTSLTLTGDLTVGGGATVVGEMTSESVYETLNSDKTADAPTEDMGFRARRGASPWWVVGWDETNDRTIIGTSTDGTVANTTGGVVVVGSVLAGGGTAAAPSYSFSGATGTGLYRIGGALMSSVAGTWKGGFSNDLGSFMLTSSLSLGWSSGHQTTPDLTLYRDAANVLAQRNSTNAQTFRIYGTYTDASNYERLQFDYGVTNASLFSITTAAAGSGTARGLCLNAEGGNLNLQTGSTTRWAITSAGHFLAAADNTYDIGASGATRPRTLYLGTSAVIQSDTGVLTFGASSDLQLARLGAASLRQGFAPSATPIAQTFTIGEASRPGTDTDIGGASGTIRSGLGTGTGAASSIVFQTPTLVASGSLTQTYADRLTVATAGITATVPFLAPDGASGATAFGFATQPGMGLCRLSNNTLTVYTSTGTSMIQSAARNGGAAVFSLTFGVAAAGVFTSQDVGLDRLAAASLRLGLAPSATPVAQTFTIGEASRPGTDTDVAGANGTIRSGLGTGTGTPSKIVLITPTAVASGSTVQTYDSCFVALGGLTNAFPAIRRSGTKIEGVLADESNYCAFRGSAFFDANNVQVLGAQGAAVADATGGATVDAEARTAINTLLARMRAHGSIAT